MRGLNAQLGVVSSATLRKARDELAAQQALEKKIVTVSIQECQQEVQAQMGTFVPATMKVGEPSSVRVEITKDLSAAVKQRLSDQGLQVHDVQVSCEARVLLAVRLDTNATGNDFDIGTSVKETFQKDPRDDYKRISAERLTPWEWLVTPHHEGKAQATIQVETRIRTYDGPKELSDPVWKKTVAFVVTPNWRYSFTAWIRDHSTMLLTGLCIPFIVWIGKIV